MDPVAPDDVRGEGAGFRQGEIAVPAGGDRVAVESPADVSGVGGVADAERDFRPLYEGSAVRTFRIGQVNIGIGALVLRFGREAAVFVDLARDFPRLEIEGGLVGGPGGQAFDDEGIPAGRIRGDGVFNGVLPVGA